MTGLELTGIITFLGSINLGIITNEFLGIFIALIIAYLMSKEVLRKGMGIFPALWLVPLLGFTTGIFYTILLIASGLYFAIGLITADGFDQYEERPQ